MKYPISMLKEVFNDKSFSQERKIQTIQECIDEAELELKYLNKWLTALKEPVK